MTKPFEQYTSGGYLENNPTWDEEDSAWKASQVLKMFSRNHLTPKSIVDVGCGAGGILASLSDAMPEVACSGFEIASDAARFWEKYSKKRITFSVGDYLQAEAIHCDVILLLDVLEHVPNPFAFLSALLGRADYFVFHIPLDLSAMSVTREHPLLLVRQKVGHIHYFTKNLAFSLLQESGFEVLDWFYTGASFTAPRISWKAKLVRLPRRLVYMVNRDWGVRLLGGDTLMVLAKAK